MFLIHRPVEGGQETAEIGPYRLVRDDEYTDLVQARRDLAANEGSEDARLTIAEATIEKLTGSEARERLARRLFLDAHAGDRYAQQHWDFDGDQHINREPWLARAGKYMAVIAGREN